jgi:hypothetical protein
MNRFLHTASVLFGALGLFFLVVSVVLVPTNRALGEEMPAPPAPVCPEVPPSHACDDKCYMLTYFFIDPVTGRFVHMRVCENGVQPGQAGTCKAPPANCAGCACKSLSLPSPPFPPATKTCGCW